jgi:hypothetical protein
MNYLSGAMSAMTPGKSVHASAPSNTSKQSEMDHVKDIGGDADAPPAEKKKSGGGTMNYISNVTGAVYAMAPSIPGYGSRDTILLDEGELTEDVARRKEDALGYMLRTAKNKYIARGLEGKITIQMLYGVVTSGEYCTVSKFSVEEKDDDEVNVSQLSSLNYKALSAMDTILANLVRRSKRYESADLRSDTTLTQGVSFGISVPFLISVGFSTSIHFEVTAASLIAYRFKKDKLRVLKKKLSSIPNAEELVREVVAGGYTEGTAQQAVCATEGTGVEEALRWATRHECGEEEGGKGALTSFS